MRNGNGIGCWRLILLLAITGFVLSYANAYGQTSGSQAGNVVTINPGQTIVLSVPADITASAYQWYKDGQPIPGATSTKLTVTQPGVYAVTAFNAEGCASPLSDAIYVQASLILADVAISKHSETRNVHINEPYEYQLVLNNHGPQAANGIMVKDTLPETMIYQSSVSNTMGDVYYDAPNHIVKWSIGHLEKDASAEARFMVKSTITGKVVNKAVVTAHETDPDLSNNQSTDVKEILGLVVPNIFTPNGDGTNDRFEIPGLADYPENEIQIVNRWGNSVFQEKNYHSEWTGEGLNEGTYFYILKIKNSQGEWQTLKGYVTLYRGTK